MPFTKAHPEKPSIDRETFESLMEIQASREEVMRFYGFTSKTYLQSWIKENYGGRTFEEVREQFDIKLKVSLKRKAFELAEKNPTLMIFLLKSVCGMSETSSERTPTDNESEAVKAFKDSIRTASKALSEACMTELIAGLPTREDSNTQ